MSTDGALEVKNAIIKNAVIDMGDRGLLTAWVHLDYGGTGQGFGGFALYLPKSFDNHNNNDNANYAGLFIYRVLEIASVSKWEDLEGSAIRVKCERLTGSIIHSIGNILKDDWFNPEKEFEKLKNDNN